jgi:histidyl-tRNA synthetase
MENSPAHPPASGPLSNDEAQAVLNDLQNLLGNVYADMDVSREKVNALLRRGRELAADSSGWLGEEEAEEFADRLEKMGKKVHQALDLKALKEEGLVRAVKL